MAIALFGIVGLAVDVGRLYVTKAELSRSVDAAALAGVLELPDATSATTKVNAFMAENEPTATVSTVSNATERQLRVTGSKNVRFYFLAVLGITDHTVTASGVAGFGIVPVDVYMAIDATGSMGASPCNGSQNNSGCPIWEAKNAAKAFADTLLTSTSSGYTIVGAGSFRGCYNAPRTYSSCVSVSSQVTPLTNNKTTLTNGINSISALGGTGTNVCLGMLKGQEVLFGAGHHTESNTHRFLVILSDGDNTYNNTSYSSSQGAPPTSCRPTTSPSNSDGNVSSSCYSAQTRERQLDTKTQTLANTLKGQDVEIYVVGFGVCGNSNTNLCNTSLIGGTSHDDTADRNLAKCIASSTAGTNDHYFEVATASALPGVFQAIAQQIAHRLIE